MNNNEYSNAYREVIEILKYIPKKDYDRIPQDKIKIFKENSNKNYKFKYNPLLTLDEQNVSKRAKAIIGILFRDYWATEEQKAKIIAKQNFERKKLEQQKKDLYNTDNIFANRNNKIQKNENMQLVTNKKSTFIKYIEKFIKFFKK